MIALPTGSVVVGLAAMRDGRPVLIPLIRGGGYGK